MSEKQVSHTPGPWQFQESNYGINSNPGWGLLGPSDESLGVTVHNTSHDPKANARLIAASPDLLTALKRLRDDVQAAHVGADERCNDCAVCWSLKLADAAIAKAEGKDQ